VLAGSRSASGWPGLGETFAFATSLSLPRLRPWFRRRCLFPLIADRTEVQYPRLPENGDYAHHNPCPPPPGRPSQLTAYGVAGLVTLALALYFVFVLPDAVRRGREGVRRTREAPCLVLKPTPQSPLLGKLPQPAPDFALKTHDGQEVKLSALRGRVVLVNLWATWCPTCAVEEPSLERLADTAERAAVFAAGRQCR
jgi:hypothetical protein